MEEDIKNDLAAIAFTHPFFNEIVENTLNYIKQLEEENKELNRKLKIKTGDVEYLQNKINKHFISKVEIKAKIKELKNLKVQLPVEHMKQAQIQILEKLLGEE